MAKLSRLGEGRLWSAEARRRAERGLIALYQEDGLPVVFTRGEGPAHESFARPLVFFSSVNQLAQLTADFDNVDDVRGFTSEALLAPVRRNGELPKGELRGIIRIKGQFETANRFRFRYKAWPAVDISYKYREVRRGQLTNFFEPGKSNDVSLHEFGVSVEKPPDVSPHFDLFVRGVYKRVVRRGLIEFLPSEPEHLNQYEAHAVISRYVGPDRALLNTTYVFQDINQPAFTATRRDRRIAAATFTYQLLRLNPASSYRSLFETRGVHLFVGAVNDQKRLGPFKLVRSDYFTGASLKGLSAQEVTIQPAVFTSRVEGDLSHRRNSQYRTNLNLLWRIKDEEREPGLPEKLRLINPALMHLAVAFKHDVAIRGSRILRTTTLEPPCTSSSTGRSLKGSLSRLPLATTSSAFTV